MHIYIYIYIYIYIFELAYYDVIGLVGRVFTNGPEDLGSIPGRVILKTLKMILDTLTFSNKRYVSTVKWSNPRKRVAPSLTYRWRSYWKGTLLVALDYGHQLFYKPALWPCGRVFANSLGDWGSITHRVIPKTQKMVLDTSLLNTQLL